MPDQPHASPSPQGYIWDIKRFAIHDGPGIRTTVFLLGCPLSCLWCCNPESQQRAPRLLWLKEHCQACGTCVGACPQGAIQMDPEGKPLIDKQKCDLCRACVQACPGQALVQSGRRVSVEQVLAEVRRDEGFFMRSGGGLTLSGGEPLAQPEFVLELARQYKQNELGPHLALETSGQGSTELLLELAKYVDVFLYDLKHMDSKQHRACTGMGNELILDNARVLAEAGSNLVVRLPLIPGYNDSEYNVLTTVKYAKKLPGIKRLDLLPYHRLGEPKYQRLGREYTLAGAASHSPERIAELVRLIEGQGLEVRVGG